MPEQEASIREELVGEPEQAFRTPFHTDLRAEGSHVLLQGEMNPVHAEIFQRLFSAKFQKAERGRGDVLEMPF